MDFKDFEKIKENYISNMNELIKIISPLDSSTFIEKNSIEVNLLCSKLQGNLSSIKVFIENKDVIDDIKRSIIDILNAYDTLKSNRNMRDIHHLDVLKEYINDLMSCNSHLTFNENFSKFKSTKKEKIIETTFTLIEIDFKDYGLVEYNEFKEMINICGLNKRLTKNLPILLRILFETLLKEIFNLSIAKEQKYIIYEKKCIRDFSELIAIFNILKDNFFIENYATQIHQKIIDNLKQFREEGNFDVHDIIKKIESNYSDNIKDKVKLTLDQLLQLYRRINQSNNKNVKIENENILKQIYNKIDKKEQYTNEKKEVKSHCDKKNVVNQKIHLTEIELRRPNKELINTYLEFINDLDISSEDLYDHLCSLLLEIHYYNNLSKINEEEIELGYKIIQIICKNLLKREQEHLINIYLEILYRLGRINVFIQPLTDCCLKVINQWYIGKKYFRFLIELLDICGSLPKLKEDMIQAIDEKNYKLLEEFGNHSLSAYKNNGISLVKILVSKSKNLSSSAEDLKLKELIKKIIKVIETDIRLNI